jgi:S-formylglutathione hydrolase FrmB
LRRTRRRPRSGESGLGGGRSGPHEESTPATPSVARGVLHFSIIALSAAFSPNPAKPELYIDLPFEPNDGRMVPKDAIIAAWRSKMPLYLVDEYRQNLERLRGIYLDYGAREEFSHIRTTTRAFSAELANRGIAHTFEVYPDGNHENTIRERLEARVFRFFSEVLRVP